MINMQGTSYLWQFASIALIQFLAVAMPGPDFAIVVKNALLYSRRTAIYTAIGIGLGAAVHMTYCLFGLAIVITQTTGLFTVIKTLGSAYLIYIGIKAILTPSLPAHIELGKAKFNLQPRQALRQGFLCNLLNPKATLYFLGLFTLVIQPQTPIHIQLGYGLEMFAITILWFICLALVIGHQRLKQSLQQAQAIISKLMGACLIVFGTKLAFLQVSI